MPPEGSESHQWYRHHLQPHEAMLRAWLRSRFPSERDIDDVVQESILRVLRAREAGEVRSPKAFLFVTARNLVIAAHRKSAVRPQIDMTELSDLDVQDETADVSGSVIHSEELELLTQAIQALPDRCRQIVTLRKLYGLPQQEIARELGISENTVENQGAIGLRKLAAFFEKKARRPLL
jgi:RNA polymerase sigma-70 factor (ECF subfamily)